MHPRFRKIAVFAGAAVLAGGVGVAVASQGGEDAGSRAALTQAMPGQTGQGAVPGQSGQGGMRGGPAGMGGGPGALDLETLADELGVSTGELQTALQDLRPAPPTQNGENPLVTALATALDLPESKVAAALEAVRPSGAPGGGTTAPDGSRTPPSPGAPPSGSDDTTTDTELS
jgi:hypothetical protein